MEQGDSIRFEDGLYGRRVVLCSAWSDVIGHRLKQVDFVELELNQAKGWRGDDISFLREFQFLRAIDILDFHIKNVGPIHYLHDLRRLGITTYDLTEIRFAQFPQLEDCALEWRPLASTLFDCTTLKRLFVNRYDARDTNRFSQLVNLESLSILNAPIENLVGLDRLQKLQSLRLGNLKRLTSLNGIQGLLNLVELNINTCPKVKSINEVSSLSQLRRLYLNNCGDILSLKPLQNVGKLESVLFYESTNIVDGDLSPLMRQKNLTRVSFRNRSHYSHKREEFGPRIRGVDYDW